MKHLPLKLFLSLLAVIMVSNGYSQCPAGLISYWRLQESDGTTFVDEQGNHNALAGTSAPLQTAGISGNAQLFNGSSFLSVPSHADFNWTATNSYSIELWVKTTAASGNQVIIGRDDPSSALTTHWWIGVTALGKINWYTRASDGSNGVVTTTASFNDNQWHHIVAVRDGALQKHFLYVDGILQNTGGTTVTLTAALSSTADVNIGNMVFNMTPQYFFNGAIDEIAIYNRVLTESEITGDYTAMRDYSIGYCSGNSPEIISVPDSMAIINQAYSYDVNASGNPAPTYSLVQGPKNMSIAAGTGVISWLPTSFTQNVPVFVRASNSNGTVDHSFNIFLGDAPVCRDNLIASWDFDNTGGSPYIDNIADYKLTGINPSQVTGLIDKALLFDGVNDSLNLKDDVEPAKIFFDFTDVPSFSIELWMKSSAVPTKTMVMVGRDEEANNSQFWLGVLPTGEIRFYLRDYLPTSPNSATLTGGSVLDGEWHHVVATLNATSDVISLYVDKILVDETIQSTSNFGGNNNLNIGCMYTVGEMYWYNGLLDELAFYNTALSGATVINNYNAVAAGNGACFSNFAPLITTVPDSTVDEDSPFYYKLIANDIDPTDTLGIYVDTKPAWVNFTYNRKAKFAVLTGTPDNSMIGEHPVKLRVSDGSINVEQSFNIIVANINNAPTITSTPGSSINEDALYSYAIIGNDIDAGSTLTYSSAPTNPDWLTLDPITHVLSGIPTNDHVGVFSITVSVSDGIAPVVNQTYQLTVNNVNDLPVVTSEPTLSVEAGSLYMYEMIATDVDEGDVLTFAAESSIPAWLTFTPGSTSGILTGTPTAADLGAYAIILKVNDGTADVLKGFTITVTAASALENIDNSIINSVYPNPVSDKVHFRLSEKGEAKVEIYDLSGNLQKQIVANNEEIIEINLSDLSTGLYIYKVYQNDKIGIGKVTKN